MKEQAALSLDALLAEADWLRPLARKLASGRDADADDLIQDSIQTALAGGGPKEGVPLRPWLRRVMLNLHAFRQRTEMRRRRRELFQMDDRAPGPPDELVMRAEFRQAVAAAVLRVREPYRRTLLWRFFEGKSITRIARKEGVTAATVRSRIHRGLHLLRADLGQSWGEDWRSLCLAIGSVRTWAFPGAAIAAVASVLLAVFGYVLSPEEASTQTGPLEAAPPAEGLETSDPHQSIVASDLRPPLRTRTELDTSQNVKSLGQVVIHAIHAVTGEPVPNARVTLIQDRWQSGGPGDLHSGRIASWNDLARESQVLASTNAQGRCRISPMRNARTAWLVADGLSGFSSEVPRLPLDWEPRLQDSVVEVTMWPDLHLPVEVVDEAGIAIPDIPVALGLRGRGSGSAPRSWEGRPRAFGFSDASGIAMLHIFGADTSEALEELHQAERIPRWEVWHAGSNVDAERFAVEGLSLGSRHIRARVVVRHRGAVEVVAVRCPAGARAFLEEASGESLSSPGLSGVLGNAIEGARTPDGFQFHGLPLGSDWRLTIAWPPFSNQLTSQWGLRLEGPSEAQEAVQVQVDLSSSAWMTGRFAPPASGFRPPTSADLSIFLNEKELLGHQNRIAIPADSQFNFCIEGILEMESERISQALESSPHSEALLRFEPTEPVYNVDAELPLAAAAECRVPLQTLLDGGDLGQLTWGNADIVLEGRVRDHAGSPVSGVRVRVSEFHESASGKPGRWERHGSCVSGPEGRFALSRHPGVRAASGRLRVTVSRDTDPSSPRGVTIPLLSQEFLAVSGPVDLQLTQSSLLKVRYRNTVDSTLRARLILRGPARQIDIDLPSEPNGIAKQRTRPIPGVPTGTYRISLELHHGWTPVQRTELGEIQVGPEPTETALVNVSGLLESTRLTLLFDGANLSHREASLRSISLRRSSSSHAARTQQAVRVGDSFHLFHLALHELRARGEEQGGWLIIPGYTPHYLADPWADQTVTLMRSPRVTLHVPNPPAVPPGGYWVIAMDWQEKPDGIRINPVRAWFGSDQTFRAELPAFGTYTLRWQILDSERQVIREAMTTQQFSVKSQEGRLDLVTPSALDSDESTNRD